jgi:hypothetical protein
MAKHDFQSPSGTIRGQKRLKNMQDIQPIVVPAVSISSVQQNGQLNRGENIWSMSAFQVDVFCPLSYFKI